MSRIAKKSISIPKEVIVRMDDCNCIFVSFKSNSLFRKINKLVIVKISDYKIELFPIDDSKLSKMQSGTARSLIYNMIFGVTVGFEKKLQLVGVGYKSFIVGDLLKLKLGYSHVLEYKIPSIVFVKISSNNDIILKSVDKEVLGKVSAKIRDYKKPESYKGKGIRYFDERIVKKEAKKK